MLNLTFWRAWRCGVTITKVLNKSKHSLTHFPLRCQAVMKNIFLKSNKNMDILLFSISVRYEISVNKLRQMFYKIAVKSNLIPKSIFPISSYRFMEPYQCIESYRILMRQNTTVEDSLRKIFILRSLFELLAEVLDVWVRMWL